MSSQNGSKVGIVFYGIAAVLGVAGLVLYILNVNQAYYADMNTSVAIMLGAAIACLVGGVAISSTSDSLPVNIVADVLRIAVPALLFYAVAVFVGMRAQSLGQIFGSNLELGNAAAFEAGTQAIYTMVVLAAAWLVSVIAAFMKIGKRNA